MEMITVKKTAVILLKDQVQFYLSNINCMNLEICIIDVQLHVPTEWMMTTLTDNCLLICVKLLK